MWTATSQTCHFIPLVKYKLFRAFTKTILMFVEENSSVDNNFYNLTLILRWLYIMKFKFRKAKGTTVNIAMYESLKKSFP